MIRKAQDTKVNYREHMKGGEGTVKVTDFILSPDELCGKGRLFGRITLDPGCTIGFHVHEGESELFYVINGPLDYNDNGEITRVDEGDVMICPPGSGHGLINNTDKTAEVIAVIVYE